jgi:O-antigen/teichoic acid export membrane protein
MSGDGRILRRISLARPLRLSASTRIIITNASSLVGTTAVTSVLGVVFWGVAAHGFSPDAVGLAGAAVTAMTLLGTFATLGMNTLLVGELGRHRENARTLLVTGLVAATLAGAFLGFAYTLVGPLVSSRLSPLAASAGAVGVFALGAAFTALTLVLDQALVGLLRGGLQLSRNTLFAVIKLAALVLVVVLSAHRSGMLLFATWVTGTVVSLVLIGPWVAGAAQGGGARPRWYLVRQLRRSALGHHAMNLAIKVPLLTMPTIVLVLLSATANAHFYIAWMIASFGFVVPTALTTVLYATGSDISVLADRMRVTLRVCFATGFAMVAVLLVGASPILHLFGGRYATSDTIWTLRLTALAIFPLTIKSHFVAITRILGRVGNTARFVWLGTITELAAACAGALLIGLPGVALGWLLVVCVEAGLMSRTVLNILHSACQQQHTTSTESARKRAIASGI